MSNTYFKAKLARIGYLAMAINYLAIIYYYYCPVTLSL